MKQVSIVTVPQFSYNVYPLHLREGNAARSRKEVIVKTVFEELRRASEDPKQASIGEEVAVYLTYLIDNQGGEYSLAVPSFVTGKAWRDERMAVMASFSGDEKTFSKVGVAMEALGGYLNANEIFTKESTPFTLMSSTLRISMSKDGMINFAIPVDEHRNGRPASDILEEVSLLSDAPTEAVILELVNLNPALFHAISMMGPVEQVSYIDRPFNDVFWETIKDYFSATTDVSRTDKPTEHQRQRLGFQSNRSGFDRAGYFHNFRQLGTYYRLNPGHTAGSLPGLFAVRESTAAEIYASRLPTVREHTQHVQTLSNTRTFGGQSAIHPNQESLLAVLPSIVYHALLAAHFKPEYIEAEGAMYAVYRLDENGMPSEVEFLTEDDFFSKYAVIKQ